MGAIPSTKQIRDPTSRELVPLDLIGSHFAKNPVKTKPKCIQNWTPSIPTNLLEILALLYTKDFPAFNYRACDFCGRADRFCELVVCSNCETPLWHWDCIGIDLKPVSHLDFFCPKCSCPCCDEDTYPVSIQVACVTCFKPLGHHKCMTPFMNSKKQCLNCVLSKKSKLLRGISFTPTQKNGTNFR